ncbi:hypothetical protein [Sulfurirhabdus autotrophica]|uniref:Uncharacterized protein n=1 Tax=Sulfurirhabdus autotrophica TaxID=1706046 RepID=A0A4R3Y3V3_9PROT|nr:hypothetical protein [Sulfurirhabdus autotrophica]TCV85428.1 hypothetical protein EDC63_10999 [Sulfurirhabdus autotrophica]
MQLFEVQHSEFREQRLTVEAAGWFRGPRLLLNGNIVPRQKGCYKVKSDSGAETTLRLKYNYLDPIPKIKIGEEVIELASSLKWYEYVWMNIPIVLMFIGGAIGGLVGALGANASGKIFRSDRGAVAKYGFSALITLGAFIAYVILPRYFSYSSVLCINET